MIKIVNNGSKWYGQKPDSIESLLKVLKTETLDPTFEDYGNFIEINPQWAKPEAKEKYKNCVSIHGNFLTVSHVFNIITNDKDVIDKLYETIINNKNTNEYKEAKKEYINKKNHNKIIRQQFEKGEISSNEMYELLLY